MNACNGNVEEFSLRITQCIETITSYGQTYNSEDLILQIIKGLQEVKDTKFKRMVERHEEKNNDGEQTDPLLLLSKAKEQYQTRQLDDDWCAPDEKDETILALQADVVQLKLASKQNSKTGGKGKSSRANSGPRTIEPWETEAPKAGGPTTKKHKNKAGKVKDYNWCPKHKRWVIHTASECKLDSPIEVQSSTIQEEDDSESDSDSDTDRS